MRSALRSIDRVRLLAEKFEALEKNHAQDEMFEERRALIFSQLDRQTSRDRLIQRAMVAFCTALGIYVATSVAIAVVAAVARGFAWIAVVLGLVGAVFMLYASVLLIVESRMALAAVMSEMNLVWKVSQKYAGAELTAKNTAGGFRWPGKKRTG